jgi:hypothetical protein
VRPHIIIESIHHLALKGCPSRSQSSKGPNERERSGFLI